MAVLPKGTFHCLPTREDNLLPYGPRLRLRDAPCFCSISIKNYLLFIMSITL